MKMRSLHVTVQMALDLAAVLLRLGGLLVPAHLTTKSGSCESGFRFLLLGASC